jgi:CRP/FNR family cyclic AMP-dependent transcriptional regulator
MAFVDDTKYNFLVADDDADTLHVLTDWLKKAYPNSSSFTAADGAEAFRKISNALPTVLITDLNMPKMTGKDLIQALIRDKTYDTVQILIVSGLPEEECYVDEVLTGRISFIAKPFTQESFIDALRKSIEKGSQKNPQKKLDFNIKALKAGEILFKEGDAATSVYLVKKGTLCAVDKNNDPLGNINETEFVGEMAHFTGETRSATVSAFTDCQLIEIPFGNLEMLLFSKPSWAKALMKTLSNRLKQANKKPL